MLAKRIIPCLDVKEGRVVKGTHFVNLRDAGDPVQLAAEYDRQGADELVFLDITASHEKRDLIFDIAARTAEQVFIPYTVGGGIRTVDDIRRMIKTGADKCSINTAAVENPQLISEGAERFGSQCIVVAIDAKRRENGTPVPTPDNSAAYQEWLKEDWENGWEVYVHGGRTPTGTDAIEWAMEAERMGAGEILLTSMDGDGAQAGYDVALTRNIAERINIPVIASGGAGTIEHITDAVTEGNAEAALIASIVHYGTFTIQQIKTALRAQGVEVRLQM